MECPTCGVDKKLHTKYLWETHQRMHEAYKAIQKIQEKRRKKYNAKHGTGKL